MTDEVPVLGTVPADEDDVEPGYPGEATFEEARRHACLAMLCATAEGPLFESMVKLAKDMEQYLIDGSVPTAEPKPRPKLAGVKT